MHRQTVVLLLSLSLPLVAASASGRDAGPLVDGDAAVSIAPTIPPSTSPGSSESPQPDGGTEAESEGQQSTVLDALLLNGAWSTEMQVPGGSYGEIYSDTAVTFNNQVYLFGIGVGDHRIYVNRGNPVNNQWSYW